MSFPSLSSLLTNGQIAGLVCICLPLTALWGYSLIHALKRVVSPNEGCESLLHATPLDGFTWGLLILLTGWFGGLAYFITVVSPPSRASKRRLTVPVQAH